MEASSDPFWVYILRNPKGRFYIGSTQDLSARMIAHNTATDKRKFTHKHGPWTLAWSEQHPSRSSAMIRERQLKRMKSSHWIQELIRSMKPSGTEESPESPA